MDVTKVISGSWQPMFESLVASANESLVLCAPYVSRVAAGVVVRARGPSRASPSQVLMLTDLSPTAICAGATDPGAIALLQRHFPNARTVHLPRLHAKVYAADRRRAVVTSGNLTGGGLGQNHELGVRIESDQLVDEIVSHVEAYAGLGALVDGAIVDSLAELGREARDAYRAQVASASRVATRRLRAVLQTTGETLIRARLAGGPIHTVFAATIEFLLARHGPLSTVRMHSLVQQIHPDLCDDTVDRVIDGERFGKKWKHAVRTAQQQLKSAGGSA